MLLTIGISRVDFACRRFEEGSQAARIDYGQSADRRERPYAGTGKPNSIDADSWRQMSTQSREIYVQTERELSLREERDPADPSVRSDDEVWRRRNSRSHWLI